MKKILIKNLLVGIVVFAAVFLFYSLFIQAKPAGSWISPIKYIDATEGVVCYMAGPGGISCVKRR